MQVALALVVERRALVIDDEESVRTTLAASLSVHGYEVTEAASVLAAIAHVRTEEFDVVVSDVWMPGLNGIEGVRWFRELRPNLPVILITAFDIHSIMAQALANGAYTVVPKPTDTPHLLQIMERAMSGTAAVSP